MAGPWPRLPYLLHGEVRRRPGAEPGDHAKQPHRQQVAHVAAVVAAPVDAAAAGGKCIKIGLPRKLILTKRKGLLECPILLKIVPQN